MRECLLQKYFNERYELYGFSKVHRNKAHCDFLVYKKDLNFPLLLEVETRWEDYIKHGHTTDPFFYNTTFLLVYEEHKLTQTDLDFKKLPPVILTINKLDYEEWRMNNNMGVKSSTQQSELPTILSIPSNIYLITDSTDELVLLIYLITLQGSNNSCKTSLSTLSDYIITTSRNKTSKTIQSLKRKGYIDYIRGNTNGKANEYSVNMEKIIYDIRMKRPLKDLDAKAQKEYKESQKDAMALQRIGMKKDLLIKANTINKIKAIDEESGVILN